MAYHVDDSRPRLRGLPIDELPCRLPGMQYMDEIGSGVSAYSNVNEDVPKSFDPESEDVGNELTIVVSDAQKSFGATSWCITAMVTIIGGVLAYFASGRALRPLRAFAAQIEHVQPGNLADSKISEDVLPEFKRFSESFNGMINRLDAGFAAQRQFSGNAAHELRTPLALMQTQMELFAVEHPDVPPATNDLLTLLRDQTERMSSMTSTLLEMSELRAVPLQRRNRTRAPDRGGASRPRTARRPKGHRPRLPREQPGERQRPIDVSNDVQPCRERDSLQPSRLDDRRDRQ